MDDLKQFSADHTAIAIALLVYIGLSGLICWPLVRRPLARWWNSQFILIGGSGVIDLLGKKFAYWVGFELVVFIISCIVGSLGGWIYVVLKSKTGGEIGGGAVSQASRASPPKTKLNFGQQAGLDRKIAFSFREPMTFPRDTILCRTKRGDYCAILPDGSLILDDGGDGVLFKSAQEYRRQMEDDEQWTTVKVFQ